VTAVFAFDEDHAEAGRLAQALGLPLNTIGLHHFPDGESMPTLITDAETVIIYRSFVQPDGKLMPLLLASEAALHGGAKRLVLVAPYMPYLRQDAVFAPGQPLSRDVIGPLLGACFDRVVTVEPHLHRTADLGPVFSPGQVTSLSAAAPLASHIGPAGNPLIVGPDAESAAWTTAVAKHLDADHLVFAKIRRGDRSVELKLPRNSNIKGRRVVLIDDICSSGATLTAAVPLLRKAGAASIEVAVVHALFTARTTGTLKRRGAASVVSTDSCPHPTNRIALAPLLAEALIEEVSK
jgi:ribose-phosphate pyrophosphokinase